MSCAYLLLAHKNLHQVKRLVRRLLLSGDGVVIHFNARTKIPGDFLSGFNPDEQARIYLAERRWITEWGSFETVTATLYLLQAALKRFPSAGHFLLVSGQDYPLKDPQAINAFFDRNDCTIMQHMPLLQDGWQYGALKRINRFYWARDRKSLAGFFFRTIPFPPRRFPIPVDKIHVGSAWWAMKRDSAARILKFVEEKPEILRAFRWTYIPDEMFFSTVLVGFLGETNLRNGRVHFIEGFALPRDYLRLKILNRNGIRIFGVSDFEKLRASPALFARKFDMNLDSKILDLLDETVAPVK